MDAGSRSRAILALMIGDPIHCGACGIVVGLYEPAVVIERGMARNVASG